MKKNTKEWIQYGTAVTSLLSGISLSFLSFFFNNYDISNGVLWYVSQTLVYAGSIFGVGLYINSKFGEIRNYLTEKEYGSAENNNVGEEAFEAHISDSGDSCDNCAGSFNDESKVAKRKVKKSA